MTATKTKTAVSESTTPRPSAPEGWRVTPEGSVPVADVVRSAHVPHSAVDYAIRLGLVDVLDQHGQGRRRYIAASDGLLILAAAALALSAGVALAAMLRAIKSTGATAVSPQGLTLTIKF
ncbi:MAG: hypothetical protein JWO67_4121 [Streptosporangiaceae bacterium]|nr:hypothetical protein [Streptosporangiaceae bacterium]